MLKPKLYIAGQEVDLYDDERLQYDLSIKDFRQFDKTIGNYSRPFTVPASKNNNKIFEHYYDSNVVTSYNPNVRQDAVLELNGIPYKSGLIILERAIVENGSPKAYQIVFYENLLQLKNLLGETRLYELTETDSISLQDREFGIDDVLPFFGSSSAQGVVFTPLISTSRFFTYSNASGDTFDIGNEPIVLNELRPAVAVDYVIKMIESQFNINLIFDTFPNDPIGNPAFGASGCLYMWCNREEGRLLGVRQPWEKAETRSILSDVSGYWDPTGNYFEIGPTDGSPTNTFVFAVQPLNDSEHITQDDITYEVCAYNLTTGQIIEKQSGKGLSQYYFDIPRPASGTHKYQFFLRTPHPFKIGDDSALYWAGNSTGLPPVSFIYVNGFVKTQTSMYLTDNNYTTLGETYTAPGQLPNIKVFDFLVGLAKMFNFLLVPGENNNYKFIPFDKYYTTGTTKNWTKYVDQLNYEVGKVDFYGEIRFLYEENETILSEKFRNTVGGGDYTYGDLVTSITDASGNAINQESYEVKVPFTSLIWERPRTADGFLKNFYFANGVDEDGAPTKTAPVFMYYNGTASTSSPDVIKVMRTYDIATNTNYTSVNICSDRSAASSSFDYSLNFGSEINIANNSPDPANAPTLYNLYYKDMITDLYDTQARQYEFPVVLPIGEIIDFDLSDKIIIGHKAFYVNSLSIDLTTGKGLLKARNVIE